MIRWNNPKVLTLLCIGALALSSQAGLCANLLRNAGFENGAPAVSGSDSSTGSAAQWSYAFTGDYCTIAGDSVAYSGGQGWGLPAQPRSGAEALRVWSYGSGEGVVSVYQDLAIAAGTAYTASVYAKPLDITGMGFGAQCADKVALWVQDLDSGGNPVGDLCRVEYAYASAAYQPLTASITSATGRIRFGLCATISCSHQDGYVLFDDCSLEGAAPNTLAGRVTSNGTPVAGALVTYDAASAVTDSNGEYTIVFPTLNRYLPVRASANGYLPQKRWRTLSSGISTVDIDMPVAGDNLLVNPGFDDGTQPPTSNTWPNPPVNWVSESPGFGSKESTLATYAPPAYFRSGEEAWHLSAQMAGGPPQSGVVCQQVAVLPNNHYVASAWLKAVGSNWTDPAQRAALYIRLVDAGGSITQLPKQYLQDYSGWTQVAQNFDTGPNTASVIFGVWANMTGEMNSNRVIIDDCALAGPGPVASVSGTATDACTGQPVADVTVSVGSASTTTAPDGTYSLQDVRLGTFAVTATKAGYHGVSHAMIVGIGANTRDFAMPPEPVDNLLADPSFELLQRGGVLELPGDWSTLVDGWHFEALAIGPSQGANCNFAHDEGYAGFDPIDGEESMMFYANWAGADSRSSHLQAWQEAAISPMSLCIAGAWTMTANKSASGFGNAGDEASLLVQELRADGSANGAAHSSARVTAATNGWVFLGTSFYPQPDTTKVRYILDTKLSGSTIVKWLDADGTVGWDHCGLQVKTAESPTMVGNLSECDGLPTGTLVKTVAAKVITSPTFGAMPGNMVYLEDEDRTSGIKAIAPSTLGTLALGDRIIVTGRTGMDSNGERYIAATDFSDHSTGTPLGALGLSGKALGLSQTPKGILVTIWGRVTYADPNGAYVYIDDGSGIRDGTGKTGMMVTLDDSSITKTVGETDYVVVTGLLGRAMNGTISVPAVRPRTDDDIR